MQIKFSDSKNTVLTALDVRGQSTYYQGANRDSLEIQLDPKAITFDALKALTGTAANLAHLTLVDGDKQYQHDSYVLRSELALRPVTLADGKTTEDRLCVTLCQLSALEQAQAAQMSDIAALGEQVAALSIGGGAQ